MNIISSFYHRLEVSKWRLEKKRHMDVIFNSIISIPLEGASRDEDSLNCPSVAYKPLSIDS